MSDLRNLLSDFDLIFQQWSEPFQTLANTKVADPCNVYTKAGGPLIFEYAVPGRSKSDIDVSVDGNILSVNVNRLTSPDEDDSIEDYLVRKIRFGAINHKWKINATFDLDQAQVSLKNGLLTVQIPWKKQTNSKKLDIN